MSTKQITLAQVSMNNMVTGDDRTPFMGKTIKVYFDSTGYNDYTVEDFMPDQLFKAEVVFSRIKGEKVERIIGFIFKEGFGIKLSETQNRNCFDGYKAFLEKFETPKTAFNCGIEIRISKDLVARLKKPLLEIQDKFRAYEGMFGRLKEAKTLKAFKANQKGSFRTSEEETVYSFKIDSRAVEFVAEMAVDYTDYVLKKTVALMSLLDFSDFAYKAKEKVARFKKEVEDTLK